MFKAGGKQYLPPSPFEQPFAYIPYFASFFFFYRNAKILHVGQSYLEG